MKSVKSPNKIVLALLVVAFVIVPYFFRDRAARPGATKNTITELTTYRDAHKESPEELALSHFRNNQIIFMAEPGKYHEPSAFITSLIPLMGENEISTAAVSFLNYVDQEEIDRLVTGESFDEELAAQLLFNNMVMNGYAEYRDFIYAVWKENKENPGIKPLRLLALSPEIDWTVVQKNGDTENPDIIRQVYAAGVPDTFMANILQKEVIEKGDKALVYGGLQNSLSGVTVESYEEKMTAYGFPDDIKRTARLIKELPHVNSCTLLIHGPWTVDSSRYGIDYPLGGALDGFMEEYEGEEQFMGLFTGSTPYGKLQSAPGSFGSEGNYLLSDICDGYILLGPMADYTPFTALPQFINESNYEEACEKFPGPKEVMPRNREEYNNFIAGNAAQVSQVLEKF
ncbi:MAG: hypothetical protein PQJ59_09340 [Spirochaetales bacterium]|nr:hypothetical protein [Spirochaetales bacterium]